MFLLAVGELPRADPVVASMIELARTIHCKHLRRMLRFTGVVDFAAPSGGGVEFLVVWLLWIRGVTQEIVFF